MAQQRNNAISIAKGFAIIFVVMAHADMPGMLNRAIYLFHMPLFFITAGYFFKHETVENPWPFIVKRFKGLYVPFVKWSIFFLLIHNLLFKIGILNEVYGNWTGGTTHPYSIHQFWQRLTNIVFSMGGYDEFLAGAFWFFRGLLVASIAFVVLYYMLNNVKRLRGRTEAIPLVIFFIALGFTLFKAGEGIKIVTLVQGGYRDTMGVLFFSIGVLYRKYEQRIGHSLWLAAAGATVVLAGSWLECRGMSLSVRIRDVLSLPVTGVARMADDIQHFLPPVAPQGTHNPVFGILRRAHSLHLHLARVGIQGGQPTENMVVRTRPTADRVPHGDSRLCADRLLLDSVHHCRRRHSAVGILALQPHPAATPFFLIFL